MEPTSLALHTSHTEWLDPFELREEGQAQNQDDIERIALLDLKGQLDVDSGGRGEG